MNFKFMPGLIYLVFFCHIQNF